MAFRNFSKQHGDIQKAMKLKHSSVARSRHEDILSDIKLQSTMFINSSLTTNESSHSTNQYCKKLNSAPKTPTKAYSVVNDLKNALSKEACRIIHSLQRWINANKLLLLVISGTMLLITSTIALDCSIYFAAMARRHIMNIEDSLQEFRKDIAATANFKRKIRAAAEKKKNLHLPLAVANLNRNPKVKNKPKVTHGN
uniref:Uncharacterized protein n=1 Tax=Ascaris lumbricoides TaxID=6252 RepID=A0A0M3IAM9_ASCLU